MSLSGTEPNSRLLIVDDNQAIHGDFQKVLARKQAPSDQVMQTEAELFGDEHPVTSSQNWFHLDSAFQGEEALRLVRQALDQRRPYTMAFMDVRMPPGLDGIETTARIWEIDPDLQIVICTAYSDYSWEEMLAKLGRSDRVVILKKPFDNVEVLQLATSLSRKWQLLQESKTKMAELEEMVLKRTAQVVQEQERFKAIFDNSPEGILQTTPDGRFLCANPALAAIFGYASPEELMSQVTDIGRDLYVNPERREELKRAMELKGCLVGFEAEVKCKDGSQKWTSLTACKVAKAHDSEVYQGFVVDITAQVQARRERDLMEAHLRQAQKLESVGQLAAGIAHEINTPIQYIGDNIRFVKEAFGDLTRLMTQQQNLMKSAAPGSPIVEVSAAAQKLSEDVDLAYLNEEVPKAIGQSLEGVERVSTIVRAMKEFSHPGTNQKSAIDLNHAIESTITVARNEWKCVAEVVTEFDATLPPVPCLAGEFNQVILNLVINATHAIADVVGDGAKGKGTITISTRLDGDWAEVRLRDTGGGIPENIRTRIFEPFFTTKGVGKGTGQGLAISHSVIVDKHSGTISFETELDKGTTFIIRLPIVPPTMDLEKRKAL